MAGSNTLKLQIYGNVDRGEQAGTWHLKWNELVANLEARLTASGTADPNFTQQSFWIGQLYIRTGGQRDIYMATNVANPGAWISLFHHQNLRQAGFGQNSVALVSAAGLVTPDLAKGNFFALTLTENTTIQNPINALGLDVVVVEVTQDAAVLRNLSWGNKFFGVSSGVSPAALGIRTVFTFIRTQNGDLVRQGAEKFSTQVRASADFSPPSTGIEAAHPTIGVFAFPGGLADGRRAFRASIGAIVTNIGIAVVQEMDLALHFGPLGTIVDPIVALSSASIPAGSGGQFAQLFAATRIVPGATDKLTVGCTRSVAGVFKGSPADQANRTYLLVEEL